MPSKPVTFRIEGLGAAQRALSALPGAVARKVIRPSIREAMRPVKAGIQSTAPVKSGAIRRHVKIRAAKRIRRGAIAIRAQIGKEDFQGDQYYAAMVNFGHAIRRAPRGPEVGRVAPVGFMERAFQTTEAVARSTAIAGIKARLPDAIREARRAGGGK